MDLVRSWLRQLLGAGAAAALVPAAIVGALVVVLVGAGGFGGLGALGQLVAGPEVAPVEQQARDGDGTDARGVAPVSPPVASESPSPRRTPATPPPAAGVAPPSPPAPAPPAPRPRPTPPPAPPQPRPPVVAPPPPPATTPAPPRRPTLEEGARNTTEELKETVDELGTAVGQIVEGVLNALGRLLGVPPPPPAP